VQVPVELSGMHYDLCDCVCPWEPDGELRGCFYPPTCFGVLGSWWKLSNNAGSITGRDLTLLWSAYLPGLAEKRQMRVF
jgi:hypothetical protein